MQDKYGFEPLPKPPLSSRDVGKLRREQFLLSKMGYATRMPQKERDLRKYKVDLLLLGYELLKAAQKGTSATQVPPAA